MTKSDLRKSIKSTLQNAVSKGQLKTEKESLRISNLIINSESFKNASTVLAYMALPDEVDLSLVISTALSQNKTVALPKCNLSDITMEFYRIQQLSNNHSGSYGIQEPEENEEQKFFFSKTDEQILFLIPGRAFTKNGDRLGRGKAYYDKYLAKIPQDKKNRVHLAGVSFPQQIVESIPTDEHDIKMNYVFY